MLSRRLRWSLPVACSVSLVAGSAWAVPTVQLTPQPTPVVTRVDSSGKPYGCPQRLSQAQSCLVDGTAQGIGYHDCIDDTKLRFSLAMTGVPDVNYALQVWAGTGDCTQAGATNNASTGICWKVAPDQQMAVTISPLDIRVADIVSGLGFTPPNLPQTYTAGVSATTACNNARGVSTTTTVTDDSGVQTSTAGVATVTIYFLVFTTGAGSQAPVANASYPVKVKLVGPNAVSDLTVKTGDGEIILGWTPPSGDPTVQGFDLFAVPSNTTIGGDGASTTVCSDASTHLLDDAGQPVLDDAGNPIFVPDDAGCTTTSNSSTATCGSTLDVSAISCPTGGDAGGGGAVCELATGTTTNSGTISGLTNATEYVATVAAYDQYGNAGTPTQSVCETPAPIDDFWKIYNEGGGNAYCALSFVGARGSAAGAGLVAMFGMIWLRRRKRR